MAAEAQQITYPTARKTDQSDEYFGTKVADPYRWMEDDNAPETKAWVEAQNNVTNAFLAKIPYRAAIKQQLEQRINFARYGLGEQRAGYVLFYQNNGLQNQSVLMVQRGYDGKPEVLLDPNTFSTDGTTQLKGATLSQDGRYLAYDVAPNGADWQEIRVLDMQTRQPLADKIEWVKFGGASWRGSEGFFYSRYPQPEAGKELTTKNQNQQIFFHRPGTPQTADVLVHSDPAHPAYYFGVGASEDGKAEFMYVGTEGKRGNALYWRPGGGDLKAPFQPIIAEIGDDEYTPVDHIDGQLLIKTNQNAPNSKILRYDPKAGPGLGKATVLVAEKPEPIDGVSLGGGKLVVSYLKDATSRVELFDLTTGKSTGTVALPGPGSAGGFNGERTDKAVLYTFTSYNYPATLFRYDLATGKSTVWKAPEIKGFSATDYVVKQVFVPSKDGTKVPAFIVHKKGLKQDGTNPTILYGYGGFNISLTPSFSALRLVWLDQGGVYVVANLRGGAEYGEKWHEGGMRQRKQNVFDDCAAIAEFLIKEKYTSAKKLALQGGSNGGLLTGAVINQRPDLFGAAIPQVGVMDMLRYQKFTAGQFWVAEYGSAEATKEDFATLYKYSPLHNIKAGGKYPAVMVTTSDHDDRVVPAHSFKYAATLQERADHGRPLLIRIQTNAAHGGSSLTKAIEETADIYAFLFQELGVKPKL
jgi:prolyl oligopeptidase